MSQSSEMNGLTKELRHAGKLRMAAVKEMREAARSTLASCAQMRGEVARDYRAQTNKFLASLAKDVAAHRHRTAGQIARTQKVISGMAKEVGALRRSAANDIVRFTGTRSKATAQVRSHLGRQVDAMAKHTESFMSNLASARKQMGKRQHASLAAGRQKLASHVASFLNVVHVDQMKAHDIWKSFGLKGGATGG